MHQIACKYCLAPVSADTAGKARRAAIDAGWAITFPEVGPNQFACAVHVDLMIEAGRQSAKVGADGRVTKRQESHNRFDTDGSAGKHSDTAVND